MPAFVAACQEAGLKTPLVSGGFTFFSERVRARCGWTSRAPTCSTRSSTALTGRLVERPTMGDIVDGHEKKRVVLEVCELMGIDTEQAIAVGTAPTTCR